jgi:sulfonate transport system ATP-binding protein
VTATVTQTPATSERRLESFTGSRSPELAVRLRGVSRSFGTRVVLRNIDLEIARGQFVVLLGQSGTGKSTLLRATAGLDDGVEGSLSVASNRAVVFQEPRLLPWRCVWRNVALGLEGPDTRSRAVEALAEVGLGALGDVWPATLSGGEAQRASLARALVREPDLLLLDEPFGALDALTRLKMQGLVRQLCARHEPAVLLVTHDVDEAIALADRILVLDDGHFITDVTLQLTEPRRRSNADFVELRAALLRDLGVDDDLQ